MSQEVLVDLALLVERAKRARATIAPESSVVRGTPVQSGAVQQLIASAGHLQAILIETNIESEVHLGVKQSQRWRVDLGGRTMILDVHILFDTEAPRAKLMSDTVALVSEVLSQRRISSVSATVTNEFDVMNLPGGYRLKR